MPWMDHAKNVSPEEKMYKAHDEWIKHSIDKHNLDISTAQRNTCQVCDKYKSELVFLPAGQVICNKHFDRKIGDAFQVEPTSMFESDEMYYNTYIGLLASLEFFRNKDCKKLQERFPYNILNDKQLDTLDQKVQNLFLSAILTPAQAIELIKLCDFEFLTKFTLIYRASKNGFSAQDFHARCDQSQKTLTLIKVKNDDDRFSIFGGYTEASWEQTGPIGHYKEDKNAFIFSLVNRENKPLKMKTSNPSKSIYVHKDLIVSFGAGESKPTTFIGKFNGFHNFEFMIYPNSNRHGLNRSYFGTATTFVDPFILKEIRDPTFFLQGKQNGNQHGFQISEIEVFQIE